jgi:MFS family permease
MVDVWWKLIVVAILFSFGHGVSRPPLTSIITQHTPPNRRGGVFGAMTSLESLSRIIGPILGGWIITKQPRLLGWVGGALFTIAVMIALTIKPISGSDMERQQASAD